MATEEEEVAQAECYSCATEIDEDDVNISNGETYCNDCVYCCEKCSDVMPREDAWYTIDGSDLWCEDCTERYSNYCEGCDSYTTSDMYYTEDRNDNYCENCIEDAYYCEDCDMRFMDGHDCDSADSGLVHDYNYRPDTIFHSTDKDERIFFGIEIEVEAKHGSSSTRIAGAEYAQKLEQIDLAYLKNDGSLNCGFEIVTHPMTHDFYKNEAQELWDTLDVLRKDMNMVSWNSSTCGLHVHISRTGFDGGAHMHRFLQLVYSNESAYSKLAGRDSSRWAKFDDVIIEDFNGKMGRSFKRKLNPRYSTDRYSAVNTQNTETFEMRIFKGSLNPDTVKSALDLAHASVEYTRHMSVRQVVDGALNWNEFASWIDSKKDKYDALSQRMARVFADTPTTRDEE